MMQTNSPRAIDSHKSSNTVVLPPPGDGKRLLTPSMEMNLSVIRTSCLGLTSASIFLRRSDGLPD